VYFLTFNYTHARAILSRQELPAAVEARRERKTMAQNLMTSLCLELAVEEVCYALSHLLYVENYFYTENMGFTFVRKILWIFQHGVRPFPLIQTERTSSQPVTLHEVKEASWATIRKVRTFDIEDPPWVENLMPPSTPTKKLIQVQTHLAISKEKMFSRLIFFTKGTLIFLSSCNHFS
jgi:hypothetical protein